MLTEAQQRLYGFILKRLVDHVQSNEVLQLTNIVLCRKANDFKKGTNFMAWALTVANFQILSFRKKQSRDRLIFSDETFDQIVEEDGKRSDDTLSRLFHLKKCLKKNSDYCDILRCLGTPTFGQRFTSPQPTHRGLRARHVLLPC